MFNPFTRFRTLEQQWRKARELLNVQQVKGQLAELLELVKGSADQQNELLVSLRAMREDLERRELTMGYPVSVTVLGPTAVNRMPAPNHLPEHEIAWAISAQSTWLRPGDEHRFVFRFRRQVGACASVAVQGPAVLKAVWVGQESCSLSEGAGVVFTIPHGVPYGFELACDVMAFGPQPLIGRPVGTPTKWPLEQE